MTKQWMRFKFMVILFVSLMVSGHAIHALPLTTESDKNLRILRITPEGENVDPGNQIVIEFNRPVVPLGRMQRQSSEIPITFIPKLNCQWRWLNLSTLACQLDQKDALVPATHYELTIKPGIKTQDNVTLAQPYHHQFITKRPEVENAWIDGWRSPTLPQIKLITTQPVKSSSLQQSLSFFDIQTRYPVKVFPDINLEQKDDSPKQESSHHDGRHWIIIPAENLPPDSSLTLLLQPGLQSTLGNEKNILERQLLHLKTFSSFRLLGLRCQNNQGKSVFIHEKIPGSGEYTIADVEEKILNTTSSSSDLLCNPLTGIALIFNSPVSPRQVKQHVQFMPKLPQKAEEDFWQLQENEETETSSDFVKGSNEESYPIWIPPTKAGQSYTVTVQSKKSNDRLGLIKNWNKITSWFNFTTKTDFTDQFGRKMPEPFQLHFSVDHRKPNYEMIYHDAVLEKYTDSEVPLYVNNLKKIIFQYKGLTAPGEIIEQSMEQSVPQVPDLQFAIPLGIRKMLHNTSGILLGNLSAAPSVSNKSENDSRLLAQVTPYQVQVKLGHFNGLVWVTDLASGQPVTDAKITISMDALTHFNMPQQALATVITNAQGIAVLPGTSVLTPNLSALRGWQDKDQQLLVWVNKGEDMALLPLNYDYTIDTWRVSDGTVWENMRALYGHVLSWGLTAQGIYRPGETIQYKFYVRHQNNETLTPAPQAEYDLQLIDPTGNVVNEIKNLSLSVFGAYHGEFSIPKNAPVGWYQFQLTVRFPDNPVPTTLNPMRVLVSDFSPAPFKVNNQLNGDLFHSNSSIKVETTAKLYAGGPYAEAQARITAILTPIELTSDHSIAKKFSFSLFNPQSDEDNTQENSDQSKQIYQTNAPLNDQGELETEFTIPDQSILYGQLTVESAVQDDRGKYLAAQSQANYTGVDRFIGLFSPKWVYQAKQPANIQYLTVDAQGNPIGGVEVDLTVQRKIVMVAKIKTAGNVYASHYQTTWETESTCHGRSQLEPLTCQFTPKQAGDYRVIARIQDTQGKPVATKLPLWVIGEEYVLWNDSSDNYISISTEKPEYNVNDVARLAIKNPYPGAQALITVERYGILDYWVKKLESSTPILEIPIKPDYLPGVYISVTIFSPRVPQQTQTTTQAKTSQGTDRQIDLAKPTFKMGYLKLPVKDPSQTITITTKTNKPVYRPRDLITLTLQAIPQPNASSSEPVELAVAVVDESVFALLQEGKSYYDPYQGFYRLDGLDLNNYSLLMRLIGRQKFEKKGANPGGDGGMGLSLRHLFKFVAYWNPSIQTDANGNATVQFPAPDNLTGWRVLALATTPGKQMGLGEMSFKVNRPTELRPVMPNQVTEGDDFYAGFNVLNRTDKERTLTISITAQGDVANVNAQAAHEKQTQNLPLTFKQTLTLAPFKRASITMPVQVTSVSEKTSEGKIRFIAKAGDEQDHDTLEFILPVKKARTLEIATNYGDTTQNSLSQPLAIPKDVYSDTGNISVVFSPSVIANLTGAFSYMKDYPYLCWEQILTKGVMASHYQQLKPYLDSQFAWEGSQELPKTTLEMATNFQAPHGGMAFFIPDEHRADPYLSAYTALAFNWLRDEGYSIPETVERKLHDYLSRYLRLNIAPQDYTEDMNSTVRAVALAALAEQHEITLADLQRYQPYVPQMSLFGKAHFVEAAIQVKGGLPLAISVSQMILGQANQSGGKFIFSETLDDGYQRILSSPLRSNCAILSAFTHLASTPEGKTLVGDVPTKLARMISQTRKNRDHWENTQENMFCMRALIQYSKTYESVTPNMKVQADITLNPEHTYSLGNTHFTSFNDPPVTLSNPLKMLPEIIGNTAELNIHRMGAGRLYYSSQIRYAPRFTEGEAKNAGIEVKREYHVQRHGKWELLSNPMSVKAGELIRVDLYITLPAARHFVVVNDPVPGGLEPVNRDLATTSQVDAEQGKFKAAEGSFWFKFKDWIEYNASFWSFYHQELRHDSVRFYADYLPAGHYQLSYVAQAIIGGNFEVMPLRAEEMYDPEVFGQGIKEKLIVHP